MKFKFVFEEIFFLRNILNTITSTFGNRLLTIFNLQHVTAPPYGSTDETNLLASGSETED